ERTGVGTYAANLIRGLLEVDREIEVVLVSDRPVPEEAWLENPRVRRVVTRGVAASNNLVWSNVSLRGAIAAERIDLFHGPGYTRPFRLNVPSVVTLHDISYAAAPQWYPHHSGFLRQT